VPRLRDVAVDPLIVAFAFGLALATGVLFGLAPLAGQGVRRVSSALKEESGRSTGSRAARRVGSVLVVGEIAVSVVLLTGAGLLVKSLVRLSEQQTGIAAERVLAFDVALPAPMYATPNSIRAFHRGAIARLRTLPAVTAAAITTSLPMYNPGSNGQLDIDNRPWKQNEGPLADVRWLSGDYFETLKVPLIRGRLFTDEDTDRSPLVAVVNQALASKCWPGQDPIGKRVNIWGAWRQVVGVVGDVRSWGPAIKPELEADMPAAQDASQARTVSFVVRTSLGDPLGVARSAQREIQRIDPGLAVSNIQTMDDVVSRAIGPQRLMSRMMSVFALLAGLLAAVGVYGLIAYTVGQRRWEFGVRMAMGADRALIVRLVLARGVRLAAMGVMLGAPGALGVGHAMKSMLHQVAPADPWVLGATCLAAVAVTLAACYVPERTASRVNPIDTLRAL
jgi:predicted permease